MLLIRKMKNALGDTPSAFFYYRISYYRISLLLNFYIALKLCRNNLQIRRNLFALAMTRFVLATFDCAKLNRKTIL